MNKNIDAQNNVNNAVEEVLKAAEGLIVPSQPKAKTADVVTVLDKDSEDDKRVIIISDGAEENCIDDVDTDDDLTEKLSKFQVLKKLAIQHKKIGLAAVGAAAAIGGYLLIVSGRSTEGDVELTTELDPSTNDLVVTEA